MQQIEHYDLALVSAVKRGDIGVIRQLATLGRRMDACNKHGESIVHIACRRGNVEILKFLLAHGAKVDICDDQGRTPLHDACWNRPSFECVKIILELNLHLLRVMDCRGAPPLDYIKREHWPEWRKFFDMVKEKYWAPRGFFVVSGASDSMSPGKATITTTSSSSTTTTASTAGEDADMESVVVADDVDAAMVDANDGSDTDETTTSESTSLSICSTTSEA